MAIFVCGVQESNFHREGPAAAGLSALCRAAHAAGAVATHGACRFEGRAGSAGSAGRGATGTQGESSGHGAPGRGVEGMKVDDHIRHPLAFIHIHSPNFTYFT